MKARIVNHDFRPINQEIELELDRHRVSIEERRVSCWHTWSRIWLRGAIALAIVLLAAALAWWFIKPNPEQIVVHEVVAATQKMKVEKPETPVTKELGPNIRIVENFTKFTTVTLPEGENITTGRVFATSEAQTPSKEYCYYNKPAEGFWQRTDLGVNTPEKGIRWKTKPSRSLQSLAKTHCRFSELQRDSV